jgi:hypothetical protein
VPLFLVRARQRLRQDGVGRWEVPAVTAEALFYVPFAGALLLALVAAIHSGLFSFLVAEDSALEWAQAATFTVAGLLAGAAAYGYVRTGERVPAVLFALVAVGSLFIAGEEISWGQRIVGFDPPERLEDVNIQEEATIHNIAPVRVAFKLAAIGIGVLGALGPWVLHRRTGLFAHVVPPLFVTSAFAVLAGYNLGRLIFFSEGFFGIRERSFVVGRLGEWPELCLGYALAAFAFLSWRTSRRRQVLLPPP